MASDRAQLFGSFMIAITFSVSSALAQDAQDNSQRPNRREDSGANRRQQQGGMPRKQINPRQREALRKMRERTENGPVPAGLERRTIQVGQTEREYFINIPLACQGKPSPVVFVLHGGASSSGIAMHLKTDFTKLGANAGYVTVYPSGVNGWNIGSHDMYSVQRRTSNADDIGFFRRMFDELVEKKIADPARIYLVGGSNGGVMTQYLVCNLADRIAAAGVMVATLPRAAETKWTKPTKPVPIIVLLGTEDPMKPWDGNRDQMSAEETIAYWRKQNKCDGEGKKWELPDKDPRDGCRIYAHRWDGAAPVVFYIMQGHGHGWPMQRRRANEDMGKGTGDISAPEEYWSFFASLETRP
jgi:polyhydroxybutyrate depolymerase